LKSCVARLPNVDANRKLDGVTSGPRGPATCPLDLVFEQILEREQDRKRAGYAMHGRNFVHLWLTSKRGEASLQRGVLVTVPLAGTE
jgi:hypothetical protein